MAGLRYALFRQLEPILDTELILARGPGRLVQSTEIAPRIVRVARGAVCLVQHVEHFKNQLNRMTIQEPERLGQTDVGLRKTGLTERVPCWVFTTD